MIKNVKCVIVGDGTTGKTCLLKTFTNGRFPEEMGYEPTVFDNYFTKFKVEKTGKVQCEGQEVGLELWDTAGQEEFDKLRELSYHSTDVFLVVYSVISPNSFENVKQKWVPELQQKAPNVPIVLIGTKTDLRNNEELKERLQRKGLSPVTTNQGEQLRKELQTQTQTQTNIPFVECSSKQFENVGEVFQKVIEVVLFPEIITKTKKNKTGIKNIFYRRFISLFKV